MYFRPVFALLLVLLPFLAFSAPTQDQEWEQYKATHGKNYADTNEELRRYNLYKERARYIAQHNAEHAQGKHSYSLKLNHLSDMTNEELQGMHGARIPAHERPVKHLPQPEQADRQNAPMVDWRNDQCMSPIKSQGLCGSCWAFTATCLMEFAYCKQYNLPSPVLLSEQNIVDCTYNYDGCSGGIYINAWKNTSNMASAATYPYVSGPTNKANPQCNFNSANQVTRVKSFSKQLTTVSAMEQALANGPIAVALYVDNPSFQPYSNGIYNNTVACNPQAINTTVNHAVALVGYNNNNNPPYWILRNHWNTTWGMNGYMYIQKGINLCNIEYYPFGNVQVV